MQKAVGCYVKISSSETKFFAQINSLKILKDSVSAHLSVDPSNICLKSIIGDQNTIISDEESFSYLINYHMQNSQFVNFTCESVMFQSNQFINYRIFNKTQKHSTFLFPNKDCTLIQLSQQIIQQEGLDNSLVCAFYSNEGNPLVGRLYQMYDVMFINVFSSDIGIFVIPYSDVIVQPKVSPYEGTAQVVVKNSEDSKTYNIKVRLNSDTVMVLKQKIYFLTKIPPVELTLDYNGETMTVDSKKLNSYKVLANTEIIFTSKAPESNSDTYKKGLVQSLKQTVKGVRILHHFLYCFKKNVSNESTSYNKIAAVIRYATNNCSPLLHSLYELRLNKDMSHSDAIALEEGFLILCNNFLNIFKVQVAPEKIFEHTLEIFGIVLKLASENTSELQNNERYETINSSCALNYVEIVDPVVLEGSNGKIICELKSLQEFLKTNRKIPNVERVNESQCRVDHIYKCIINRNKLERKENITRWVGIYDISKSITDLLFSSIPMNSTWKQISDFRLKFKLTKLVRAMKLTNGTTKYYITLNKEKEYVINVGIEGKMVNKVELLNVIEGSSVYADKNELALITDSYIDAIDEGVQKDISKVPEEAVAVVFDASESMSRPFFDSQEFSRLDVARQCFDCFADRCIGYNLSLVSSIVIFNNSIITGCKFTENILNFTNVIKGCRLAGGSKLWDAISHAVNELKALKNQFQKIRLRILCLSDGKDHGSQAQPLNLVHCLQSSKIILDSVVIGKLSKTLKAACFATGGCIFTPQRVDVAIKLFESETFLFSGLRIAPSLVQVNSEEELRNLAAYDCYTNAPGMKAPFQIEKEVVSLAKAFREHSEKSIDNIRNPYMFRRIMSEMKFISSNRNSHISIFPCKDDLTFWSVIINGPETSVYEGGTFLLYIKFGDQYPASPPEFRFLTPIYHCNISSTGRICHSILGQFYSSDTKIKKILDCIYGLLLTPEPNDPLDSNVAAMYKDSPDNFRYIAKYWVQNYASAQADALLKGIDIRVSMSPDFIDAYNGDIMQMPIFVESLGCNLDTSTVDNILANPQAYPGIVIDPLRLVFNNELYARIQEYLENL